MPVPAGISFPMITFSLRPSRLSLLPWMAASVSTFVVSWKEAADSHDSVASEALVMPMSTGRAEGGSPPSAEERQHGREQRRGRVEDLGGVASVKKIKS